MIDKKYAHTKLPDYSPFVSTRETAEIEPTLMAPKS